MHLVVWALVVGLKFKILIDVQSVELFRIIYTNIEFMKIIIVYS